MLCICYVFIIQILICIIYKYMSQGMVAESVEHRSRVRQIVGSRE